VIDVKTYVVDVDTSCTLEEGSHSPSWSSGLDIIIIMSRWRIMLGIIIIRLERRAERVTARAVVSHP
jgi:hypothetical protein